MHILVVDDELSMREYLDILLTRAGYSVTTADSPRAAKEMLARAPVDLVVSDMKLGTGSGLEVLAAARALTPPSEVILITAYGTPESAVEAMRAGAYDYIRKPFDNEELRLLVKRALEKRAILRENERLRQQLGGGRPWIGQGEASRRVMALVEKVAASPRATVLITGESGTGKELVARAIHWRSSRAGQPFIPVNCAALSESLLESELFGHVKGAFTGATQDRPGLLLAAGEGSVLLDEVGEISASMQVKLLRVLEERQVKPVGSTREVPFDARILAATNRDLEAEVRAGRFREDLLYRLNVITLELPPLRARPEDIPHLARHFLAQQAEELGRPMLRFSDEALAHLQRMPLPGNVRQLRNLVERAATLSDGDLVGPEVLPGLRPPPAPTPAGTAEVSLSEGFSLEAWLDEAERRYLLEALRRSDGVKTRAAALLGMSFRSFRYRLDKHGLDREDGPPAAT
jgi:two-component system response regulator PilR (NtrC family)